jgi:hypothetical protein
VTLTTLCVWRVRPAAVPIALWGMAVDRGRLRRAPGVRFAKLLGTGELLGTGDFGLTTADPTRWAALVVSDGEPPGIPARQAVAKCTITLRAIASRGSWAGREPFDVDPRTPEGNVLVLTRARLRARRAPHFWRAVGPVARALRDQDGLLAAFGVGEAPLGFQGTVSVWRGAADIVRFAYRRPEHTAVVAGTSRERWYAEELFARFHVLDIVGDREVIGWKDGR